MKTKRNTKQKEVILNVVKSSYIHPTAEEVYSEINKSYPSISKSTVYRNLQEMTEDGLILKIVDEEGINRFDGKECRHYHFVCSNCKKLVDLDLPYDEDINKKIEKNYKVSCHNIVFHGLCSHCHDKLEKEK